MTKPKADPCGCRSMERREFLGVGAAMGASAYFGAEPGAGDVPARGGFVPPAAECRQNRGTLGWSIPTKHLNTLWTGLWPRMAARIWLGTDRQWPHPYDGSDQYRDIGRDLQVWIESFLGTDNVANPVSVADELGTNDPATGPQMMTDSNGAPSSTAGSCEFQRALADLHAYLTVSVADGRAPIYLIGRGGYDFLLSEKGVELWAPARLPSAADPRRPLLDAYEYRRTGRPPLAIGYVMEGAVGFPVAPTGPGQIESPIDMTLLEQLCLDASSGDLFQYCGVREGAEDWTESLLDRELVADDLEEEIRRVLGTLGASPEEIQRVLGSGDPIGAAAGWIRMAGEREGEVGDGGSQQVEPCTPLSADLYYCQLLTQRCWVVSGTVFRGVLEQFPRAVADYWSDAPDANLKSMSVREECEERLETVFPTRMRFEFQDAPTQPTPSIPSDPLGIRGRDELWDVSHLMVTNTGFLFPERIGVLDANGGYVARGRGDLLTAIITGRAGNPVFTDSSACM